MNSFKVTIGKFVSGFRILAVAVINAEMPFRVFFDSMRANKGVLFLRRGTVFTPCISLVWNEPAVLDQLLSKPERNFV